MIDKYHPNTIELTLEDNTIYCTGSFRFIIYKEVSKNEYIYIKEFFNFLKFTS